VELVLLASGSSPRRPLTVLGTIETESPMTLTCECIHRCGRRKPILHEQLNCIAAQSARQRCSGVMASATYPWIISSRLLSRMPAIVHGVEDMREDLVGLMSPTRPNQAASDARICEHRRRPSGRRSAGRDRPPKPRNHYEVGRIAASKFHDPKPVRITEN
jgi:hypothetical protein